MSFSQRVHGRDLIICTFDWPRPPPPNNCGSTQIEKNCASSPPSRLDRIKMAVGQSLCKVHVFIEQTLRCVRVHVDGNRAAMNVGRASSVGAFTWAMEEYCLIFWVMLQLVKKDRIVEDAPEGTCFNSTMWPHFTGKRAN